MSISTIARHRSPRRRRRTPDPLGAMIRRAGRGDRASYAAYYDLVVGDSYRLALLRLRDPARAERAAGRAMVEAWRQSNRWVDQSLSPAAWLATLTEAAVVAERRALSAPLRL